MIDNSTRYVVDRRRFLGRSASVAGVLFGSEALRHLQRLPLARAGGGSALVGSSGPTDWNTLLFAPGEFLVSICNTKPLPPAYRPEEREQALTLWDVWITSRVQLPKGIRLIRLAAWGFRTSLDHIATTSEPDYWVLRYSYFPVPKSTISETVEDLLLLQTAATIQSLLPLVLAKVRVQNGTLCGVTPNWTISIEADHLTGGGPGGPPMAIGGSGTLPGYTFPGLQTAAATLTDRTNATIASHALGRTSLRKVSVVVMDTFPGTTVNSAGALLFQPDPQALSRLNLTTHQFIDSPLPDQVVWSGRATCGSAVASTSVVTSCAPTQPRHVADHGLFVGGIVQKVATSCDLYLMRVLNDCGGGYLSNVLDALQTLQVKPSDQQGKPPDNRPSWLTRLRTPADMLIINMSLTVKVPTLDELNKPQGPYTGMKLTYHTLEQATAPLNDIMSALSAHQVLFVTAAGNDSRARSYLNPTGLPYHFDARVPASYQNVLGVAAVNIQDTAAHYSNKGDIAILGGESSCLNDLGHADYVTGAYGTGSAHWVGTSFATPVIAGLAANLLANGNYSPAWLKNQLMTLPGMAAPELTLGPTPGCPVIRAKQ